MHDGEAENSIAQEPPGARRSTPSDPPGGTSKEAASKQGQQPLTQRPSDLELLLDYELRSSTRYRHFASLVTIAGWNGPGDLLETLRDTIRDSDEFFAWQGSAVILMGETDRAGALEAIKRYQTICGENPDLCFAVSCYPLDGQTAAQLLVTVRRRLERAKSLRCGAVVATG